MYYKFEEPLLEGLIKSRPNRFIMMVELDGSVQKCHCPSTGRIGTIRFEDIPCLLSKSGSKDRKTKYTVEAISLDPPDKENKSWLGINQTKANGYVEFFLKNGQLPEMFGGVENLRREVKLGNSRIDFLVNERDYLEVKTPLLYIPCEDHPKYGRATQMPLQVDRIIKHFEEVASSLGRGSGAVFLVCFLYDAETFNPPITDKHAEKVNEVARIANRKGVENWQINLKVDEKGVHLLRYFKLNLFS